MATSGGPNGSSTGPLDWGRAPSTTGRAIRTSCKTEGSRQRTRSPRHRIRRSDVSPSGRRGRERGRFVSFRMPRASVHRCRAVFAIHGHEVTVDQLQTAHAGHRDRSFRRMAITCLGASRSLIPAHRDRSEATSWLGLGLVRVLGSGAAQTLRARRAAINPWRLTPSACGGTDRRERACERRGGRGRKWRPRRSDRRGSRATVRASTGS